MSEMYVWKILRNTCNLFSKTYTKEIILQRLSLLFSHKVTHKLYDVSFTYRYYYFYYAYLLDVGSGRFFWRWGGI